VLEIIIFIVADFRTIKAAYCSKQGGQTAEKQQSSRIDH
jgi:hypothetical protein